MTFRHVSLLARLRCVSALLLATGVLASPELALATSQPITELNIQRQANGMSLVGEDPSLAAWCPNEEQGVLINTLRVLAEGPSDAWSPTSGPWDKAPTHEFALYHPLARFAGAATVGNYVGAPQCVGLALEPDTATTPALYAFYGPQGASAVATSLTVTGEYPRAPQELIGIPQGTTTGPDLILYALGMGPGVRATGYSLYSADGQAVPIGWVDGPSTNYNWYTQSGVMVVRSPLAPGRAYHGAVTWIDSHGASVIQTISFVTAGTSDIGGAPTGGASTPGAVGAAMGIGSVNGQKQASAAPTPQVAKQSGLRLLRTLHHGLSLKVWIAYRRAAIGAVHLRCFRRGKRGRRIRARRPVSVRGKPSERLFTVNFPSPGTWILDLSFKGRNGWATSSVSYAVRVR